MAIDGAFHRALSTSFAIRVTHRGRRSGLPRVLETTYYWDGVGRIYLSGYPGKPSALAFDNTGTLLATGGGESVTVWSFQGDGPEGTRPGFLNLHIQPVTTLAFARRKLRLASGGRDGGVVVWSLRKNGEGGPIGAAVVAGVVSELHWRQDGRALAALDARGGVTVWRVR